MIQWTPNQHVILSVCIWNWRKICCPNSQHIEKCKYWDDLTSYWSWYVLSHPRKRQWLMARRQKRGPNITAAAAVNTRGKNTSTAVSTKNTSMPLMRTRTANASTVTNTGNTNAKRAPLPLLLSSSAPPVTEKLNPLPPLEIQVWMTGPCWRIWRSRGPWSKLSWTASWWRARFSQAWAWSFRVTTLDLRRMEKLGSETENSVKGVAQVNPFPPEGERVENLDGTQQRAVSPALSVVVGVNLQTG